MVTERQLPTHHLDVARDAHQPRAIIAATGLHLGLVIAAAFVIGLLVSSGHVHYLVGTVVGVAIVAAAGVDLAVIARRRRRGVHRQTRLGRRQTARRAATTRSAPAHPATSSASRDRPPSGPTAA